MSLTGLLDAYKTPLIILAIEAILVALTSHALLLIAGSPREALKHPGFLLRTLVNLVLVVASLVAGFLLVSPVFVIGQAGLAVVIGVMMFLLWPRASAALGKGPLRELVLGGSAGLIGLGVLIWSLRPLDWQPALGGLVMGLLGFGMMFSGLRKMWRGEDEEEPSSLKGYE